MHNRLASHPAIAFDLEGTCVDMEAAHFLAFELTMADLGCRMTVAEIQSFPGAIGGGDPYIATMLAERSGASNKDILEVTMRHFDALIGDLQLTPRIGVIEVIERAKVMGCSVAIGSLTPRARGERILERSRLGAFFKSEHVVFREDVTRIKPEPDVYLETARRMSVLPSAQLVFEDSVPGVRAAVAAGSRGVVAVPATIFQEEKYLEELLAAGAERVYKGWGEVNSILRELL